MKNATCQGFWYRIVVSSPKIRVQKLFFFHFLYSKITNPGGISVNSIFRNFSPYKKHLGQSNGVFNHTNALTSEWDICMLHWMLILSFQLVKNVKNPLKKFKKISKTRFS